MSHKRTRKPKLPSWASPTGQRAPWPPPKKKRKRDYAAEYKRRIELGELRGFTHSMAAGKRRKGEMSISEMNQLCEDAAAPSGSKKRKRAHALLSRYYGTSLNDRDKWSEVLAHVCGVSKQFAYTLFHSP